MSWLSFDLRFKWLGCQMVWGSSDLVVNWCVIQMILSHEAFLRDFLQKDLWSSKTKLLCETSEAFLRDFLQKWNFEAQKRKFSARLPSKLNLWSSKTKLFCETSSKIKTLKLKNEAFLRDFLQKWSFEAFLRDFLQKRSFEAQKRSFSARLPSKMTCQPDTWPQNYNTFYRFSIGCFKSTAPATKKLSRGIRTPVTATRNDPCKVTLSWHEICNPPTDSASDASNIDITKHEIPVPATRNASFQTLFKSPTPANVFATLTNSCACHVFCNVSKSLRLPRETHFEPQKTSRDRQFLTILASKSLSRAGVVQILRSSTSKSAPNMQRGAFFSYKSLSRAGVVQILSTSWAADPSQLPFFGPTFASLRSDKTMEKHSISRNSYPPKHLCCDNIDAARATGNFQYSRKLELLNFLWSYIYTHLSRNYNTVFFANSVGQEQIAKQSLPKQLRHEKANQSEKKKKKNHANQVKTTDFWRLWNNVPGIIPPW